MKMTKLTILTTFFVIAPLFTSCAAKNSKEVVPKAAPKAPSQVEIFKSSDGWQKLDGRFKQAWEDAMAKGDVQKSFECLLKTDKKATDSQKRMLTDAGFNRRSQIGLIFTGSITAQDVPDVASLPFVKVMELAVPLSLKK